MSSAYVDDMDQRSIDLQEVVVVALVRAIPSKWVRIIASYEIEDREDGRVEDSIVAYIYRINGEFRSESLEDAPRTIEDSFLALFEDAGASPGQKWSAAEVTIDEDGSFTFKFSYDAPKRINGIYDEDSSGKFDNYAAVYVSELQASR